MNRRNFLSLAIAAALAPPALMYAIEPFTGVRFKGVPLVWDPQIDRTTNTWWRSDELAIAGNIVNLDEMERLWRQCLRERHATPLLIRVSPQTYDMIQTYLSRWFA